VVTDEKPHLAQQIAYSAVGALVAASIETMSEASSVQLRCAGQPAAGTAAASTLDAGTVVGFVLVLPVTVGR
jgi:predicted N-acetyltransferase YhbS